MKRRILSVLLTLCMLLSLLPITALAASAENFPDMPPGEHWAYPALSAAIENGLLNGVNGYLLPEKNLSRAEMAAIVNRAFGAQDQADISGFTDVDGTAWYAADIARAVRMGTFQGSGNGTMHPNDPVIRQEAFAALARAFKLAAGDTAALAGFSDHEKVASWAVPALASMVRAGYVKGSGGKLNPASPISRAEFAQVMQNMVSAYLSEEGTYTDAANGNLVINAPGVTLRGVAISGDLIIGEGVGAGDVTLDGITVAGRLVVRGGGEHSILILNKSSVGSIIINKTGDGGVRIRTEEGCRVEVVEIDDGTDDVILEGSFNQVAVNTDTPVVLRDAVVTGLAVTSVGATVTLDGATTISAVAITTAAIGATLDVGTASKIARVDTAAEGVKVSGTGTVVEANVSGNNTSVNTRDTVITVGKDVTGVTQNGSAVKPESQPAPTSGSTSGPTPTPASTPTPTPTPTPTGGNSSYPADAVTLAELQAALLNGDVSAVTITGGIVIPEGTALTFNKPVTLAAMAGAGLSIEGTLVNDSSFTSANRDALGKGQDTGIVLTGSFINNGTFVNESRFGTMRASFTNNGTVTNSSWFHCGGTVITNNGVFNSSGDITLLHTDYWDPGVDPEISSFANNAGAAFTATAPGVVHLGPACTMENSGTVNIDSDCHNFGTIGNSGVFAYTAYLYNAGTINGELTPGGPHAVQEDARPVETLAELMNALETFDSIAILGDIELAGDLTLDKPVLISAYGSLTVPDGTKLTVSSVSDWNELKVSGKLKIEGGTLETTQTGDDDNIAAAGQVTILGGILKATGNYIITNNGYISLIYGEIDPPDIVISGSHPRIDEPARELKVTTETQLREAMADESIDIIHIAEDITLTSGLDLVKPLTIRLDENGDPYTLTIAEGASVALKGGARFDIYGRVVNNGSFVNDATGGGIYIASGGSFINNHVFTNGNRLEVFEGTLENNENLTNENGPDKQIFIRGGVLTNKAGATFMNEGNLDIAPSRAENGDLRQKPSFNNAGTFNNASISQPSSEVYLGMEDGTLTNTGAFVNNSHIDLLYVALTHSAGTFHTYNTAGLFITGGSLNTAEAPAASFRNEGYMRVTDEYGRGGGNNICVLALGEGVFINGSSFMEYTADVYSESGLADAEAAQQDKVGDAEPGDFSTYNRLNFKTDMEISGSRELSAFDTYWVEIMWNWDENTNSYVEGPVTLTIKEGAVLTVGQTRCLHINGGILVNEGTLVTAAPTAGDSSINGGTVDIWPYGTLTNDGTVTNGGELWIRSEYDGEGIRAKTATVNGTNFDIPSQKHVAIVYSEEDLIAAVNSTDLIFSRIEIKGDSRIEVSGALTINADVYIEPGSSLTVLYGNTLTLSGTHWMGNNGDISVEGSLIIGSGYYLSNHASLEIGALSGSETATVTVSANAGLYNEGTVAIRATGSLDAGSGFYGGNEPEVMQGGTYIPPPGP